MKVVLINSRQDKAGVNIRHHIEEMLDTGTWKGSCPDLEFIEVEERLIHAEHIDAELDADLMIFLSRHYSVNPVPVLTVHVTGNFGQRTSGVIPAHLHLQHRNDAGHPPCALTTLS